LGINGFSSGVALSASGLPAGVTATFSPNPATPATPATLTLQAAASTVLGTYTFTVTGVSGALSHSVSVELIVGPPSFVLSGTPGARTVNPGQSTTFSVASKATAGFSGSIALSASAPSGITASFNPSSISGTTASTLTVTVASSVAPGTYPVTV